jgi:hypothetical protein
VELLQALADSTSVAMESVELLSNLEQRVTERSHLPLIPVLLCGVSAMCQCARVESVSMHGRLPAVASYHPVGVT